MQKAHQWLYKHNVGMQKIHTYGAFTAAFVFDYELRYVESFRTSKLSVSKRHNVMSLLDISVKLTPSAHRARPPNTGGQYKGNPKNSSTAKVQKKLHLATR